MSKKEELQAERDQAMATFLSSGGNVQVIDQGVRALTEKQIFEAGNRLSVSIQVDTLTGGTLSDLQLLTLVESHLCEDH